MNRKSKIVLMTVVSVIFVVLLVSSVSAKHSWWHFWGEEVQFAPSTCTDSDGGINQDKKGVISGQEGNFTDRCLDSKNLLEFYCDANGIAQQTNRICNNGCLNGACKNQTGVCGNGIKEGIEECDDGNINNTDSCLNTCRNAICGDTIIRTGVELCDSNSRSCTIGGYMGIQSCNAQCNGFNSCVAIERCGDSIIQAGAGEQCDDGNNLNGDGCNLLCIKEVSGNQTCTDTDGGLNKEEKGNVDGNSSQGSFHYSDYCRTEGGSVLIEYACNNVSNGAINQTIYCPVGTGCKNGACVNNQTNVCGNGIKESVEQCDDGNIVNTDLCISTCRNAVCGDGFIQGILGEECDDTNNVNGDGCSNICKREVIGNQTNQTTCTDTDGGKNYDVKGVMNTTNSTGKFSYTDNCLGSMLTEYLCKADGSGQVSIVICPGGCENGACKLNPVGGRIFKVRQITNSSTAGVSGDKISLIDVRTGDVYEATITADGVGNIAIGGLVYKIRYKGTSSDESNWMEIEDVAGIPPEARTGIQRAFKDSYIIVGNPDWNGLIAQIRILNETSGYRNDFISFRDIKTGEVSYVVVIAEGVGTINVQGKSYTVRYYGSSFSVNKDRYIHIEGIDVDQKVAYDSYAVFPEIQQAPICGNGIVDAGEVCDGGSRSCVFNGYKGIQSCNAQCNGFGGCVAIERCGDGIINGNELCDDGALNGQPSKCNAQCTGITASPQNCQLTGASWNQTNARARTDVGLTVTGSDCEGLVVLFRPLEDDVFSGDDIVRVNPVNGVFRNGVASSQWLVEDQLDEGFTKPEYYFYGGLKDDSTKNIKSGLLQVV